MQSSIGIYWHLKSFDLFNSVPDTYLDELAQIMTHRHLKKGDVLYIEGDIKTEIFLLKKGRIKLYSSHEDIQETIFEILQEGDVFGKLGIDTDTDVSGETAQIITDDGLVCSIRVEQIEIYMLKVPQLAINYANMLAQKLQQIESKYAIFLKKDIRNRLAEFFKMHAYYEGKTTDRGVEISSFLTHQEIANFIGTSRQTVTTLINDMARKNLLHISSAGIILIPHVDALKPE
jgi:CRP/FNR family transcriptional regulator, cyclic AMP receptor protein